MNASEQLNAIRGELRAAGDAIVRFAAGASDDTWRTRPPSGGWSAAECIAHLTLTNDAYIPLLRAAAATVPTNAALPSRYRTGFAAWMLAKVLEPPARMRSKTIAAFVPEAAAPKVDTVAAFSRSQDALLAWISSTERLALNHAIVASPFNARMKYNAYGALRILAAHERRHLWQAERAARGVP